MGVTKPAGLYTLSRDDLHRMLKRLTPRGKLWRALDGTRFDKWLEAAVEELSRIHSVFVAMLDEEVNPSTSTLILDGWLEAVGIPDDCVTTVPATTAEKQELALARWLATGISQAAEYVAMAADLGFSISVSDTPYTPFRCGTGRCGDAMNAEWAIFYWRVNASASLTTAERSLLECEINRLKPAHTIAEFVYS